MNNNPKIAAAAMNTRCSTSAANPSRTPEKMKPGRVARKILAVTACSLCGSIDAGAGLARFVLPEEFPSKSDLRCISGRSQFRVWLCR